MPGKRLEIPSLWSGFSSHHRQALALVVVSSDQPYIMILPCKLQPRRRGEGTERKRNTTERVEANNTISTPSKDDTDLHIIPLSMFSTIYIKQFTKNSEMESLFIRCSCDEALINHSSWMERNTYHIKYSLSKFTVEILGDHGCFRCPVPSYTIHLKLEQKSQIKKIDMYKTSSRRTLE